LLEGVADIASLSYLTMESVGGCLTNVYSKNDMILKFYLRLEKIQLIHVDYLLFMAIR